MLKVYVLLAIHTASKSVSPPLLSEVAYNMTSYIAKTMIYVINTEDGGRDQYLVHTRESASDCSFSSSEFASESTCLFSTVHKERINVFVVSTVTISLDGDGSSGGGVGGTNS